MSDGPYYGGGKRHRAPQRAPEIFPTFDEIADLAYSLFVDEGRHVELVFDYWRRAEDFLLQRAARRAIRA